jgi:hypothetical protein
VRDTHKQACRLAPPPLTPPYPAVPPPAAFLLYAFIAVVSIIYLIYWAAPKHGTSNIFVYLGICSTAGSLSVISCKVGLGAGPERRARGALNQAARSSRHSLGLLWPSLVVTLGRVHRPAPSSGGPWGFQEVPGDSRRLEPLRVGRGLAASASPRHPTPFSSCAGYCLVIPSK